MSTPLAWAHAVSEVGEGGLDVRREATPDECSSIASELDILGCNRLAAAYRIEHRPQGRFLVRGTITAETVQSCIVTLDPVAQAMKEPFEIEFRPKGQIETPAEGEHEILAADEPEPIENNRLAIGRVVYELLASSLDPYPRAGNAMLDDGEAKAAPKNSTINPFAALSKWRPKDP